MRYVTVFSYFREKGVPLRALFERGLWHHATVSVRALEGKLAPVPPITAILRIPREPLEDFGKKHEKRRGKSITTYPESGPFFGSGSR